MLPPQLENMPFILTLDYFFYIILRQFVKKQHYALYLSNVTRRPNTYVRSPDIYLNFSTFRYHLFFKKLPRRLNKKQAGMSSTSPDAPL